MALYHQGQQIRLLSNQGAIYFYAIYAVLLRNLFCRDLRALAWRKIGPKILSVEKKGQISGMA